MQRRSFTVSAEVVHARGAHALLVHEHLEAGELGSMRLVDRMRRSILGNLRLVGSVVLTNPATCCLTPFATRGALRTSPCARRSASCAWAPAKMTTVFIEQSHTVKSGEELPTVIVDGTSRRYEEQSRPPPPTRRGQSDRRGAVALTSGALWRVGSEAADEKQPRLPPLRRLGEEGVKRPTRSSRVKFTPPSEKEGAQRSTRNSHAYPPRRGGNTAPTAEQPRFLPTPTKRSENGELASLMNGPFIATC